ncbi:MAG: lysylphosphatidylglycerol synthase domain-containing protein [Bacteroidota bacterium]|nr:lysylphosphatidylglycerol synthase domain-containing protein [Bacteroidota bacterium]
MAILKKYTLLFLKILLGIACFLFLWYKLKGQFTPEKVGNLKITLQYSHAVFALVIASILMFPNWLIESYKWQHITSSIEKISFGKAVKGVLSGLCVGNLTPGRFGEFAGRILFFSPHNRSKVSVTHFICGATQLFTTMMFGILCAALWLWNTEEGNSLYIIIFITCCTLLLGLLLVILNIEAVYRKLAHVSFLQRLKLGEVSYPGKTMLQLIGLSVLRYLVFSLQYVLLLQCCGAQANYFELFVPVSVSFMLMSAIPMISFIEVAIRAGIAVILFSPFNSNELLLVTASTLLWLINIVIPSIIGYFVILSSKIKFKELKAQK